MKSLLYRRILLLSAMIITALGLSVCSAHAVQQPAKSGDFGENDALHWSITAVDGDRGQQLNISVNNNSLDGSAAPEAAMPDWESYGDTPWHESSAYDAIVIGEGVTHIGAHAFDGVHPDWGDTGEVSVSLPQTATSIGPYALKGVTLGYIGLRQVTDVGEYAFYGCTLYSLSIPESMDSVGSYAFAHLYGPLNSLTLEGSLSNWGDHVFADTIEWNTLIIKDGVTAIGDYAFAGCSDLCRDTTSTKPVAQIHIPSSVKKIGAGAFSGCGSITQLTFTGGAPSFGSAPFSDITAKSYTPSGNKTWTAAVKKKAGGSLTWYQSGAQKITTKVASSVKKTYGAKAFSLGAKTTGDGNLTYKSSNKDVASVDKKGTVKIKGVGKSTITITAAATEMCKKSTKSVKLTITLKGTSLTSVKQIKGKKLKIKWKKNSAVTGYQVQYSTSKSFKKNVNKITKKKNVTSATTKKLKKKKTYYVRIRTYKKVQKIRDEDIVYTKTYYSKWSKVKSIKIK